MPHLLALSHRTALKASILLLLLSLLVACNTPESPSPQRSSNNVSTSPRVEGFALISANADTDETRPTIVLEFSRQLVGAQKFDELLDLRGAKGETIKGSWILDQDGTHLRFPYLEANQNYKLRIKAELSAVDGKTLSKPIEKEIYSGPLQPVVGFASQGSVLPAHDSQGLPVVTLNVHEADVEFFRVREKELSVFFSNYQKNSQRGYWALDRLTKIADSIYTNRFILEAKPNERSLSYLPVQSISELTKPGLYFAVMKRAGHFAGQYETCFFFVSDIGVHVRVHKNRLWVHTASLRTGNPLNDVDIRILDKSGNSVAVKGTHTGEDGNVEFAYQLKPEHVVVAQLGSDVSLLPFNQPALDLSDFSVTGRKQDSYDVFSWSGRDLYRPGETVRVCALLRDYDGKPIKPQPLIATLKTPDGRNFATANLEPQDLGYFEFTRLIPEDAPTGRWQLEFRLDPAQKDTAHRFAFRVEEFLPERLKLDIDSPKELLRPGEPFPLTVQADYLYGTPAARNRFSAKLIVTPDQHPIATRKEFFFGDPLIELPKNTDDVLDTTLDDDGYLAANLPLLPDTKLTAPVSAVISGSVFESGGRTVTRTLKRTVWPAPALVGVRPLFDPKDGADSNSIASFEVIRSDPSGQLLPSEKMRVVLKHELREYHWAYDHDSGWRFDYTQLWENTNTEDLTLAAGVPGQVNVRVAWGEYRLEITDPQSGLTMQYPFVAGWSMDNQNRGKEARPDKVKLALDKERYHAGDTLKVTITPPQPGPGVLLVESDHLLYAKNIDATAGANYEIPVTGEFERHDVYVTALVFRPSSGLQHITPNRAVGVAQVPMDRRKRMITAELNAIDKLRPNQDLEVTVKASALAGKPAFVTLSAVDLGIINITRFPIPDAAQYLFAQRALSVDAYDLYGRVIENYSGTQAKLRYGGDALITALPQARRPTAKALTVDLFSGPVQLDAKGEAKLTVHIPDFNGTLRLAALVYGESQYATAQGETLVQAPLVAEVSTPRVMAPGDTAMLTLDMQNFSGSAREFAVQVRAQPPLAIDNGERKMKLANGAKSTSSFSLKALNGFGNGKFSVLAQSGDIKIERQFEIAVRPAYPISRDSTPKVLNTGDTLNIGSDTIAGLIPESVTAQVILSALPPLPFGAAIKQLRDYAYGCLEQTTSKAFPLIWLDATTAKKLGVPELETDQRQKQLELAFSRLSSFQQDNGHFSMWGGDSYSNTALTPYVAELLIDARDAGYPIPEATLQKALLRLNEDLLSGGDPHYGDEHADHLRLATDAYAGYVLARVQRAPLGTLRVLYDNDRDKLIAPLPLLHLGLALTLQGDKPRGEKAIQEAFSKDWPQRPSDLDDYGSELRDLALMLALTHEHGIANSDFDEKIFSLARNYIARKHASPAYLSTQEMVALFRLGRQLLQTESSTFGGTFNVNGNASQFAAEKMWGRTFNGADILHGIHIAPNSAKTIYASQDVAGYPIKAPPADASKIAIKRSWFTTSGEPFNADTLIEGESLIAAITLEAREAMPDALVTDLLPGGLEIENLNLSDAKQWQNVVIDGVHMNERETSYNLRHEEYREDRYIASIKLEKGVKVHLFYLVRAVSPGTYAVPPSLVDDMYRPELRGIGANKPETLRVVEP